MVWDIQELIDENVILFHTSQLFDCFGIFLLALLIASMRQLFFGRLKKSPLQYIHQRVRQDNICKSCYISFLSIELYYLHCRRAHHKDICRVCIFFLIFRNIFLHLYQTYFSIFLFSVQRSVLQRHLQSVHKIRHKAKLKRNGRLCGFIYGAVSCFRLPLFVFSKRLQPLSENTKNPRFDLERIFHAVFVFFLAVFVYLKRLLPLREDKEFNIWSDYVYVSDPLAFCLYILQILSPSPPL